MKGYWVLGAALVFIIAFGLSLTLAIDSGIQGDVPRTAVNSIFTIVILGIMILFYRDIWCRWRQAR